MMNELHVVVQYSTGIRGKGKDGKEKGKGIVGMNVEVKLGRERVSYEGFKITAGHQIISF